MSVPLTEADLKVVSQRQPTEQEMRDLLFAWKVCKLVHFLELGWAASVSWRAAAKGNGSLLKNESPP